MNALKEKLKKIYILGTYPEKDWLRFLGAFVVLFLILVGWSIVYTLNNRIVDSTNALLSNVPPPLHTKGDDLRDLVKVYDKKDTIYTGLFASTSVGSVDPAR